MLKKNLKASTFITIIIITSLLICSSVEMANQPQDTTGGLEASDQRNFQPANDTVVQPVNDIDTQTLNKALALDSDQNSNQIENSSHATNELEQISSNSAIEIQAQPTYLQRGNNFDSTIDYSNIAQIPIQENDTLVNNSTLSTEPSNQSILIPIRSATSTNYLAFNVLINLNTTVARFLRESIAHNASNDGAIVMQMFNQTSMTWTSKTTVFNSSVDDRNFGVGKIGSSVYLFFTEFDAISRTAKFGYIKSIDLNCSSWSDFNILSSEYCLSAYGKMVQINNSTFLIPIYTFDGVSNRSLQIWRSIDTGNTWSCYSSIYCGSLNFTEYDLTSIGSGRLIATIRTNFDCHLYQAVSLDDGFSWSNITITNLGFGGPTPYVNAALYDDTSGNFVLVGWNSAIGTLEISITPALTVLNDSSSYAPTKILDSTGLTEATYPNVVKLANGDYLICYTKVLQSSIILEPWQIIYSPQTSQP